MAFYETTAWSVVLWSLTGCLVITVAADWMRIIAARGTHRRYLWATIEHATIYPTMVGVLLQAAGNIAEGDWILDRRQSRDRDLLRLPAAAVPPRR